MRSLALLSLTTFVACTSGGSETDIDVDLDTDTSTVVDETYEDTDCSALEDLDAVMCEAGNFLATLDDTQLASVGYSFTDSESKTLWSNLPGVERTGLTQGELSDESLTALMAFARVLLSTEGYADFVGGLAADDYLTTLGGGGGGGPGGGAYGAENYIVAFYGTPSTQDNWMVQLGGHHMAYNITYITGDGYPTPNHLGAEPKGTFTIDSESYAPLAGEGQAFVDLFAAFDSSTVSSAYLSGESYADVLLGPNEYGAGSLDSVVFPTGSDRGGVLVSSLSTDEQALVTEVIRQWAGDYHASISDRLMAAYTSTDAYADTYVAWAGSGSAPNIDTNGTYFRIDGPRVWIEVACQNGVLIQNQTHFHTMYRDKLRDYGAAL